MGGWGGSGDDKWGQREALYVQNCFSMFCKDMINASNCNFSTIDCLVKQTYCPHPDVMGVMCYFEWI